MSVNQTGAELMKVIKMRDREPDEINQRLKDVYRRFGSDNIERWRNMLNKKNTFLHELVEAKMTETIHFILTEYKFPVNTERNDDRLTAYGLALEKKYTTICDLMKDLGANEVETVDVSLWSGDEEKERSLNMVWIDLEMTEIENPEILECAVIITDKDLKTLARAEWVIHYDKEKLDGLGKWHQEHFGPPNNGHGGNDLFADCIRSKNTNEYVENELLKLIKSHCPDGKCSLAGSSIHTDKNVLKVCMPKVHAYLHYRIIDVTTIQSVMRRWAPNVASSIHKKLDQGTVNHRAMQDIEWSISVMREFRTFMINAEKMSKQRSAYGESHANNRDNLHGNHQNSPRRHEARGGARGLVRRGNSESREKRNIPELVHNFATMDLHKDEKQLVTRLQINYDFSGNTLGLADKELKIYLENPHLREIFLNNQQIEQFHGKEFTRDNRYLKVMPEASIADCRTPSVSQHSTTEHWGQRKLLLTEIEFLSKYASKKSFLVIYAGAAPGCHLPFLSGLFPTVDFHVFDDKDFSFKSTDRIKVHSKNFTKGLAKQYYDDETRDILFICNIRSSPDASRAGTDLPDDMETQLRLYEILRPQYSLLYFRVSRDHRKFYYPKGDLIIEPWSSRRSNECRLIIEKDAKSTEYRANDFLASMNYFQNKLRILYYPHEMDKFPNDGLDHCYDCQAEIFILGKYLTKIQGVKSEQEAYQSLGNLSSSISSNIVDKDRPRFLKVERTLGIVPKK